MGGHHSLTELPLTSATIKSQDDQRRKRKRKRSFEEPSQAQLDEMSQWRGASQPAPVKTVGQPQSSYSSSFAIQAPIAPGELDGEPATVPCYDYTAFNTRFALIMESLRSMGASAVAAQAHKAALNPYAPELAVQVPRQPQPPMLFGSQQASAFLNQPQRFYPRDTTSGGTASVPVRPLGYHLLPVKQEFGLDASVCLSPNCGAFNKSNLSSPSANSSDSSTGPRDV